MNIIPSRKIPPFIVPGHSGGRLIQTITLGDVVQINETGVIGTLTNLIPCTVSILLKDKDTESYIVEIKTTPESVTYIGKNPKGVELC